MRNPEQHAERPIRSHVLPFARGTVAKGGDDLSVCIPLFAREARLVPLFAPELAAMTAPWCFVRFRLEERYLGAPIFGMERV